MEERTGRLRILAFEPFDAGSHRAVRETITGRSRHAWTWITRPGRAWKWRMRLAALEMAEQVRTRVARIARMLLSAVGSTLSIGKSGVTAPMSFSRHDRAPANNRIERTEMGRART